MRSPRASPAKTPQLSARPTNDTYGAIGRNGAQKTAEAIFA
jgi:hypothetical protein